MPTGFEGYWEDAPTIPVAKADVLRPTGPSSGAVADLFRIFHPGGEAAPPIRRTQTGEGAKPLPGETFWERWVTGPLTRGASAIGGWFTAPIRALKTTGLWLGGGLVVVLVVAVVGLVIVLRIVRTVEG